MIITARVKYEVPVCAEFFLTLRSYNLLCYKMAVMLCCSEIAKFGIFDGRSVFKKKQEKLQIGLEN